MFNDEVENKPETSVTRTGTSSIGEPGFAVDSEGDFYTGVEVCKAEECAASAELLALLTEAGGEYFAYHGRPLALITKLAPTGNAGIGELDYEDTTAVAVNPADVPENGVNERNDVYVDNVTTVAGEPVTTVAEFSTEGEKAKLIQRFGAPACAKAKASPWTPRAVSCSSSTRARTRSMSSSWNAPDARPWTAYPRRVWNRVPRSPTRRS